MSNPIIELADAYAELCAANPSSVIERNKARAALEAECNKCYMMAMVKLPGILERDKFRAEPASCR